MWKNKGVLNITNCATLIADLFLESYENEYMQNDYIEKWTNFIDAFNRTSRYLDNLLNIDKNYFYKLYQDIYPKELFLNKAYDQGMYHCSTIKYLLKCNKIMMKAMTLILILSSFFFWMAMSLVLHLTVSLF